MMHVENFVKDAWDVKPSFAQQGKAFWEECSTNFPLEWRCVLACEVGDILGTYGATAVDFHPSNLWGYAAGVGAGLWYASRHINRDAKHQNLSPSIKDKGSAVLSAELGCTVGATAVPAILGWMYGISPDDVNNFYSYFQDFLVRGAAIIPAIPIGMALMSAFTLRKKSDVIIITEKGNLTKVAHVLHNNYNSVDYKINQKTSKVTVNGKQSNVTITEEPLPVMYGNLFDSRREALYKVSSPAARYLDVARTSAYGLACKAFNEAGLKNHSHPPVLGSHEGHNHSHNHENIFSRVRRRIKGFYGGSTSSVHDPHSEHDHDHSHEGHHH
ncbi:hypothetical protein HYT24_01085 [Candidatus Pacearchaeota archaeon]|nr:hypothetical protein [Candidatus Pacearchaeota archaeon]